MSEVHELQGRLEFQNGLLEQERAKTKHLEVLLAQKSFKIDNVHAATAYATAFAMNAKPVTLKSTDPTVKTMMHIISTQSKYITYLEGANKTHDHIKNLHERVQAVQKKVDDHISVDAKSSA